MSPPFWQALSFWIALALATVVATAGGLLTPLGTWYRELEKPFFQPPDWLFGPAWTVIFLLTAYAGHLAWERTDARATVLVLFGINAILNVAWSYLFFFIRRPDLAVWEAALLWLSVLAIILVIGNQVPLVRWLLAPYLAWVAFAFVLNLTIVRLNAPFAAG